MLHAPAELNSAEVTRSAAIDSARLYPAGADDPLQRQAGFQQGEPLLDALEAFLHGLPVGPAVLPRDRDRHDHADDRAGHDADVQVVRGAPGALGQGLADQPDGPGELIHRPGADLGHGHGQPGSLADHVEVGRVVGGERLPDRRADRGERAEPGGLPLERLDQPGVHVVLQDEIFLGREVPEERARRDLGRLGDLLHRGGVVALLAEQPERVLPDRSTRPGLLPLARAVRPGLAGVEHVRHTSNCARSASSSPRSAAPTRGAPVIPSGRRGRKMTARTALTSAMPPQAHSIVSMPWTNAVRTEPSRAAEPTSRATPTPATTLLLASAAADAGRPLSARWPR